MSDHIGSKVALVCDDPIAGNWRHATPEDEDAVQGEIVADTGAGILLARVTHTFQVDGAERTETVQVGVAASFFGAAEKPKPLKKEKP